MSINITNSSKGALTLENPVMPAAGIFGYGDEYRDIVQIDKLGAVVTNPVTLSPWSPAAGTRVVPLRGGVLVHTGLPNPGLNKVINAHRGLWSRSPVPVIVHLVVASADEARRCAERMEAEDCIAGVELGIADDIDGEEAARQVAAFVETSEKPLIVRVPFASPLDLAWSLVDAGAGGVVVSAPPRGTARDSAGRLVAGRIYGMLVKPLVLRLVGQMARRLNAPVIGAGGIHNPQDARDYLEAGAVAVQVDSVTWTQPKMLELIARDLGGLVITQPTGALDDEWFPGMGETERRSRISDAPTPTERSE
ncbi:MAG: HisA/HisF-related TIM barrel protein [bacterium]|nr:HisA/HisF-related TIM barrel protein [bacterium]